MVIPSPLRSGDKNHYLFTFSPAGVESFYGLPEDKASKGVADDLMLHAQASQTRCHPGATIATLLPLLNTSVVTGLEQWDPDRSRLGIGWSGGKVAPVTDVRDGIGARTAFVSERSLFRRRPGPPPSTRLLDHYQLTPECTRAQCPAQIGGLARSGLARVFSATRRGEPVAAGTTHNSRRCR